jgi:hypothetical protein
MHFFQTCTLPELRRGFRCELWEEQSLLATGQVSDVVLHLVSAISIYHKRLVTKGLKTWQKASLATCDSTDDSKIMSQGQHHYAQAVRLMKLIVGSSSPDLDLIKLGCVLFAIMEFFRGSRSSALEHLVHGMEVFNLGRRGQEPSSYGFVTDSVLSRICLVQNLYGRPRKARFPSLYRTPEVSKQYVHSGPFQSLEQAHDSLIDFSATSLDLIRKVFYSTIPPTAEKLREHARLSAWLEEWSTLSKPVFETAKERGEWAQAGLVYIQYATAKIFLATAPTQSESFFDEYINLFRSIVDTSMRIAQDIAVSQSVPRLFSFDLGLIASLFYTATKCRDPDIRRKAVACLRIVPAREGVWDANEAALVAEEAIAWEERNIDLNSNTIPDWGRITDVDLEEYMDLGRPMLRLKFRHKAEEPSLGFQVDIATVDLAG